MIDDVQTTTRGAVHGEGRRDARNAGDTAGRGRGVRARAGLPLRIVLGVIAAVALVVAMLAAVNLRAASTFNRATASLTANIAAVNGDAPDYAKLDTLQAQTDAQFADAGAADAVLLPSLRKAIGDNMAVSGKLTQLIKHKLDEQQASKQQSSSSSGQSSQSEQSSSSSDGATNDGGLTDEQRRQVEELLKTNGQSTTDADTNDQTDDSTVTNNTGNTSKPW
ncbi:cell surface elastin binding protein EbpS [Bifidobacterium ramosum]|nr:cell surface elastin binding protein EbpS [Bifidobacterium ramosum]